VQRIDKPFSFETFKNALVSYAESRGPMSGAGVVPSVRATRRAARARGRESVSRPLPRGMRPDTLNAVTLVLRDRYAGPSGDEDRSDGDIQGLSAASVANAIGASRVTARRYLEYLADAGVLARSLRHRTVGRPEAIYRPVAQLG